MPFGVSGPVVSMGHVEMAPTQPNTYGFCESPESMCVEELRENAKPHVNVVGGGRRGIFYRICKKRPTPETKTPLKDALRNQECPCGLTGRKAVPAFTVTIPRPFF